MSETPRLARGIYLRGIEPGLPPEERFSRTVDYWPDCRDVVILRRVYRSLRRGGETPLRARRRSRSFLEQLERVYPGFLRADIVRDNGVSVRIIRQEDT